MPVWICIFEDREEMLAVREQRRAEHHRYLDDHRDSILLGGALLEAAGAKPSAAIWVVLAESREAVDNIVAADPYFQSGFRTCRVLEWKFARERYGSALSGLRDLSIEGAR